jgi:hypothetical protein
MGPGGGVSDLDRLRAERDRYRWALRMIALGYRDEYRNQATTEGAKRARRKHLMEMARVALQCRRAGDLLPNEAEATERRK